MFVYGETMHSKPASFFSPLMGQKAPAAEEVAYFISAYLVAIYQVGARNIVSLGEKETS